jgi:hypothetical protein
VASDVILPPSTSTPPLVEPLAEPSLELVTTESDVSPSGDLAAVSVADTAITHPPPSLFVDDSVSAGSVAPPPRLPVEVVGSGSSSRSVEVERLPKEPAVEAAASAKLAQVLRLLPYRASFQLGLLWGASAAIPAIIVWLVMRSPDQQCHQIQRVQAAMPAVVLPAALPVRTESEQARGEVLPPAPPVADVSASPAESQSVALVPSGAPPASMVSAVPMPSTVSMVSPTPVPSVVVLTDAGARVPVVIKSTPTGARVYRLGKEIARTPVIIEIAQGERRVFEVGSPSMGTRRIGVDGSKSEIMVRLGAELAPAVAAPPATH